MLWHQPTESDTVAGIFVYAGEGNTKILSERISTASPKCQGAVIALSLEFQDLVNGVIGVSKSLASCSQRPAPKLIELSNY